MAADAGRRLARTPASAAVSWWAPSVIEMAGLAVFLLSAATFTALLEHPRSPMTMLVPDARVRRLLMGVAMGLTAAAIIYSPFGRRSGAHLNPAVTLSFLRLRKIALRDAVSYVAAQFAGSAAAVMVMRLLAKDIVSHPAINYVATLPGPGGAALAFASEVVMSFAMMAAVLWASNRPPLTRYTGWIAAALVAFYISVAAPLSGMSMNPARSFAPALAAGSTSSLWIYFAAPTIGMLGAAEAYARRYGGGAVRCAKLHHSDGPCHFCDTRTLRCSTT